MCLIDVIKDVGKEQTVNSKRDIVSEAVRIASEVYHFVSDIRNIASELSTLLARYANIEFGVGVKHKKLGKFLFHI